MKDWLKSILKNWFLILKVRNRFQPPTQIYQIDGNDYWIWDAIHCKAPRVVIIETHNEFGLRNIVVPHNPDYFFPGKHPLYHWTSPVAMNKTGITWKGNKHAYI